MSSRVIPWNATPHPARGLLHLTVSLRAIRPRIWRSFVVPEKVPLAHRALDLGDRFAYTYDMGDEWVVDLVVDGAQDGLSPAWCWCTSGERSGPPVNCGGPPVLESIAPHLPSAFDSDDRWMRQMVPPEFNPNHFDLETLNKNSARLR